MKHRFNSILLRADFKKNKAEQLANAFTQNSLDGIYTHGVNRFSRFIEYTQKGFVNKDAEPSLKFKNNGIEQWDGNLGPGILNAIEATSQSTKLADNME
jgi:3-dehydro-L-gulonate 2-dehydrogenase